LPSKNPSSTLLYGKLERNPKGLVGVNCIENEKRENLQKEDGK